MDGDALLRSRWYPGTLALVHTYTLGVLGNAMFGSLLQFLPAAGGMSLRGTSLGVSMHVVFNAGTAFLVYGLYESSDGALMVASLLLPMAFACLLGMTLPGLWHTLGQRLLRMGLGVALGAAGVAALLGATIALGLSGSLGSAIPAWVDVHASVAIVGWMLVLLASVGRVVMPMFQGTSVPDERWQGVWLGCLLVLLAVLAFWRLRGPAGTGLGLLAAGSGLSFAAAIVWLQRKTPQGRRGPLWWSWRTGTSVLALSAVMMAINARDGMLAGVLAIGVAVPMLVLGMGLEIVAFLGWIELHRRVGRGVRLPGVQRLMPARHRTAVWMIQLGAAIPLVLATCSPTPWLARAAGIMEGTAWLVVTGVFIGTRRRVERFARTGTLGVA
ncbi:MAG TPA: hypothetical protein VFG49_08635 [Dyella sp.]|uniref:hypothetical protein n=1 Tax=Dyella sp. TaxID=1869338 RepID=UPI002D782E7A|nr:hypothetical protein [Dyella sp.]HET6553589.1 hypothetical protein [Dyella sp.]